MQRYKIYAVAVKVETTSGTDATPTAAADAVRLTNVPTLKTEYLEPGDRDDAQTGMLIAAPRATPAGRFGTLDLTLEVKGSGTTYDPTTGKPEADALLRMAGLARTVVAATSILYYTIDDGMETGTVYCWTGGDLIKLVGAVATLKLDAEANKRGFFTFTVTGRIATDPAAAAVPGSLAFQGPLPPLFNASTVSIGAYASTAGSDPLMLLKAGLDFGNEVSPLPSAGATDGHAGYLVSRTAVTQTMEINKPLLSSLDVFAISKALSTGNPVSAWGIGTASFNRCKVRTGAWYARAPGSGNANNVVTWALTGKLGPGATTSARDIELLFD